MGIVQPPNIPREEFHFSPFLIVSSVSFLPLATSLATYLVLVVLLFGRPTIVVTPTSGSHPPSFPLRVLSFSHDTHFMGGWG